MDYQKHINVESHDDDNLAANHISSWNRTLNPVRKYFRVPAGFSYIRTMNKNKFTGNPHVRSSK